MRPPDIPSTAKQAARARTRGRTLAERYDPTAIYPIKVFTDPTVVTTGDGKFIFTVTTQEQIAGKKLVGVSAYVTTVSSSGLPTVQVRNITAAHDMLTTKLTIDASEFSSDNATTPAVIDPANDPVELGDRIAIDVDVAGTGAQGLGVTLAFR